MPQLLTRPAFWLAAYLVLMNLVTRWGIPAIFLLQLAACGAVWYLSR